MTRNNGTGFWVVVALIAALSIAAIVETLVKLVLRAPARRVVQSH